MGGGELFSEALTSIKPLGRQSSSLAFQISSVINFLTTFVFRYLLSPVKRVQPLPLVVVLRGQGVPPHAYIFCGPEGATQKRKIVSIFFALVRESP